MTPKKIDALICGWSVMMNHSFTEEELNSLVDLLAEQFKEKEGPSGMRCPRCKSGAYPWHPCCGYKHGGKP